MPVIDTHVHVYPPEIIADWEKIASREPYFDMLARSKVHRWATAADVLARMDEDGVDQSWIFGFAFDDLGLCRACNDYVIETVQNSGGRLKGLAVVPPLTPGFEAEVGRCHEAGLIGVGELFPEGQGFQIDAVEQTWRLVGACHERDLFVLLHTAEPVGHSYAGKGTVGPKEAWGFCSNHPEVKVVFAHWGGGLWLYELMPEMVMDLENAWYDTAATPFLYQPELFRSVAAGGLGDKILYGSDFPLLGWPRYGKMMDEAGLPDDVRQAICSGNARRLLGTGL